MGVPATGAGLSAAGPKQDSQQLAQSIMAAVARSSLDALITIDYNGDIVEFGPSAEALFGYSREEAMGRPVAEVVVPPEMRQLHADGMQRYRETGHGPVLNKRVEVPSIRKDGSRFTAELTTVPFDIDGTTYFTAFVRDISQRKAYEDELKKAKLEAERTNEAKSRFVAHMSHELRSPLNAVLGAIDLMLDSPLAPEQHDYAQTIRSSGHALLNLIEGVLDFSKIEANQLVLQEQDLHLTSFLHEQAASTFTKTVKGGLDVLTVIDPRLPKVVRTDSQRLRQILSNFLDNAIKFTSSGGVILRAELLSQDENAARVRFAVEDSGPGVAADEQEHIFTEFAQTDESSRSAHDGVGLGLAIAKSLCLHMGGHFGVHSEPGHGATFWVELPLEIVEKSSPWDAQHMRGTAVVLSNNEMTARGLGDQLKLLGYEPQHLRRPHWLGKQLDQVQLVILDLDDFDAPLHWLMEAADAAGVPRQRILCIGRCANQCKTNFSGVGSCLPKPLSWRSLKAAIVGVEAPAAQQANHNHGANSMDRSLHILLVEDSPANQMVAAATLQKLGHAVEVANNGREALEKMRLGSYHGVLMDLRMPEMDGLEATRAIRSSGESWAHVPIIALTANAVSSELDKCMEAGMNHYLTKPMQRQALRSALELISEGIEA
jgi:PAS domain S-box-containing protein